jgi:three-Cys-motif partner protein
VAEPHTIAKIAMLRAYLFQWFSILGTSRHFRGKDLWYIDGFAGPGEYSNYPVGSPIAALQAAAEAIDKSGDRWCAGHVRCFFVEETKSIYDHLVAKLAEHPPHSQIQFLTRRGSFVDGLAWLRAQELNPFVSNCPVFAFIDPFGPTDLPFQEVRDLLSRPSCEVLVNLDSDGASRIHSAGENAAHQKHLDALFGDRSWETELAGARDHADAGRRVLQLYKRRLRSAPNVRFAFSFEMRKQSNALDYHLVFASGHPLGLEKMKEVMKGIDKTGAYCFSDAHVGQAHLFTFADPTDSARAMAIEFAGTTRTFEEVVTYALNESPFPNPKSMLKVLEKAHAIVVDSGTTARRRFTYPDELRNILRIHFKTNGTQNND